MKGDVIGLVNLCLDLPMLNWERYPYNISLLEQSCVSAGFGEEIEFMERDGTMRLIL